MSQEEEFVYIPVPKDRAGEVYGVLSRPKAGTGEITDDLIRRVYREAPDWMRVVLDFLAEHSGEEVSINDLAGGIGRGQGEMPGVMGSLGRVVGSSTNQSVWQRDLIHKRWSRDLGMVVYTMPEEVAKAILQEAQV